MAPYADWVRQARLPPQSARSAARMTSPADARFLIAKLEQMAATPPSTPQ